MFHHPRPHSLTGRRETAGVRRFFECAPSGFGGTENRTMRVTTERVRTARGAGMHPQAGPHDVAEGTHYEVVAYTDWADMFVPTVVRWKNGETDDFTDPDVTSKNKRESKAIIEGRRAKPNYGYHGGHS